MAAAAYEREIDNESLDRFAAVHGPAYGAASPFPHAVMDDFANPRVLDAIIEEFPTEKHATWEHMFDENQHKFASNRTEDLGPVTRNFLNYLNGREVVNFLTKLTGIEGLIPDPHLAGGGLHEIRRGGMLRVHADFNRHRELKLDRRLNLLIYLNKDWSSDFGGQLQLWDTSMTTCHRKIDPLFNRCVVFSTTDFSYHGHPDPLQCPPDRRRRSIAMYYYTNGRPAEEVSDAHATLFQRRETEKTAGSELSGFMKSFVPPIAWDALKRLKRRRVGE